MCVRLQDLESARQNTMNVRKTKGVADAEENGDR